MNTPLTLNVLHASDLHGDWSELATHKSLDDLNSIDLIILTGDMCPNKTRGTIDIEVPFQHNWLETDEAVQLFIARVGNRVPVVSVDGNHDFISLYKTLRSFGMNAHGISPNEITKIDCKGNSVRFSGFANIPWIKGEWNGESVYPDLVSVTDTCFENDFDILAVHCPPFGILDSAYGTNHGNKYFTNQIQYNRERLKFQHCFFGHAHDDGGMNTEDDGIRYFNGACRVLLHTISLNIG